MVQGRGGAMAASVLSHLEFARADTYTIGGTGGWTFNSAGWTKGKHFKASDTLVFNYSPSIHNVVAVTQGRI
ncbi:plantacyanin [Hibiscus trionum]|uniref:Plantacyanin n=1 Tax=Hibiscus trionum TaxID=183268 RepID=A0A9W7J2J5_HIBTR|nr:plantacyanin [Hibiscus trionum]